MEMSHTGGAEAESLLRPERNAVVMPGQRQGRWDAADEKAPFLRNEPVKLTPAWEGTNLPNDTLNLKGMTLATFLGSFTNVFGHCISDQLKGTMPTPWGDPSAVAITTPNSFSAVDRWYQ